MIPVVFFTSFYIVLLPRKESSDRPNDTCSWLTLCQIPISNHFTFILHVKNKTLAQNQHDIWLWLKSRVPLSFSALEPHLHIFPIKMGHNMWGDHPPFDPFFFMLLNSALEPLRLAYGWWNSSQSECILIWVKATIFHYPELRPFGDDFPYRPWFAVRS